MTSAGIITYQYDAAHRLTTLSQSFGGTAGPQVVFGYDPGNRLTSESRTIGGSGTAVNTTLAYDHANRVTTIQHDVAGGSALATYVYGYDNANRVTTEVNAEGTVTYGYDNSNELTSANGSRTESYNYDSGGNRNTTGYTTPANSGNEMTASPGETYTYDGEGNLASKTDTGTGNVWTYNWDYRDRLTGVTEKNSVGTVLLQATYTYDALNRRIGADVGGTQGWYVYDEQNPYADFSTSNVTERYLYGPALDEILARTNSGGTTAWYLTDRLGTIHDISSTSGAVIDHVVYDSYGSVTNETNSTNGDRFKFAGMQMDFASSLYFANARYLYATVGRFLTRDPVGFRGLDANLYRYASASPTNFVDRLGTQDSGGAEQADPKDIYFDLENDGPLPGWGQEFYPPDPTKEEQDRIDKDTWEADINGWLYTQLKDVSGRGADADQAASRMRSWLKLRTQHLESMVRERKLARIQALVRNKDYQEAILHMLELEGKGKIAAAAAAYWAKIAEAGYVAIKIIEFNFVPPIYNGQFPQPLPFPPDPKP